MSCQHRCSQTETHQYSYCTYQEHLILKRQSYIIQDAINCTKKDYTEPVTAREDRHKMPLPSTPAYKKWNEKLRMKTIPKSPRDFSKPKRTPTFTRPEIKVTSRDQQPSNPKFRRPSTFTIDNSSRLGQFQES